MYIEFGVLSLPSVPKEYHENEPSLVVDNAEINQVIYIFGCKNTTVQVKGKVNAVTLGMLVLCTHFAVHDDADG